MIFVFVGKQKKRCRRVQKKQRFKYHAAEPDILYKRRNTEYQSRHYGKKRYSFYSPVKQIVHRDKRTQAESRAVHELYQIRRELI